MNSFVENPSKDIVCYKPELIEVEEAKKCRFYWLEWKRKPESIVRRKIWTLQKVTSTVFFSNKPELHADTALQFKLQILMLGKIYKKNQTILPKILSKVLISYESELSCGVIKNIQ